MAQLDDVAVGVADIQRGGVALRPEADVGAVDHLEPAAALERVEVGRLDDQAEVVQVLPGGCAGEQSR